MINTIAAAQHFNPKWADALEQLGLDVLEVCFQARPDSAVWQHPNLAQRLGEELDAAGLGKLDSETYSPGLIMCFFHTKHWGRAMEQIKATCDQRGLLGITVILHAESSKEWRMWWPEKAPLLVMES